MLRTAPLKRAARLTVVKTRGLALRLGQGVEFTFPDLTLEPGGRLALTGPSGSGKTTLLHLLAGLVRPTGGNLTVAGTELATASAARLERTRPRRVGMVFQELHLAAALTAVENVSVALAATGVPLGASRARAIQLLEDIGLGQRLCARPWQLSAGERQRVAIARAIAQEPALLLADEPTAHLDPAGAEAILDLLERTAARIGAALIVASRDRRVAERFRRRVALV